MPVAIICGPIVRRTSRDEINIWFVSGGAVDTCELTVYSDKAGSKRVSDHSQYKSIVLGAHCTAVMVSASLALNPRQQLVYYDIQLNGQGFQQSGLTSAICFDNDKLPSVRIPEKHTQFLQASCRKPHDVEGIDQLEAAAALIGGNLRKASRPSQLFLTGDQIYADDVSPPLLYSFRSARKALGLPAERIQAARGSINPESDVPKLDNREVIANPAAGFTSGHGDSHLLSFSEYLCMYLFSFGGMLPGQTWPEYDDIEPHLYEIDRQVNAKYSRKVPEFSEPDYKKHIRSLRAFAAATAGHVRRLFANVAVYMIFDDHEVTDDWNLSEENYQNLQESGTGRQVYVNALSTYLICQHWGNCPSSIDATLVKELEALADTPNQKNHKVLERLWTWDWGYELNQSPPVAVIDTRTGRSYANKHLALMSKERIFALGERLSQLAPSPTLILVSPTPVYGLSEAEAIQLKLGDRFKTFADQEPWVASEYALALLQTQLTRVPGVKDIVIFSGDVHYAFSRHEVIPITGTRYWQLCSSATCNSPMGGNRGVKILKKVGSYFDRKKTKYLVPTGECTEILTSDKNIGHLQLTRVLKPEQAKLLCRRPDKSTYTKSYDLVNPKEFDSTKA